MLLINTIVLKFNMTVFSYFEDRPENDVREVCVIWLEVTEDTNDCLPI